MQRAISVSRAAGRAHCARRGRFRPGAGNSCCPPVTERRPSPGMCRRARQAGDPVLSRQWRGAGLAGAALSRTDGDGTGLIALSFRGYAVRPAAPSEAGLIRRRRGGLSICRRALRARAHRALGLFARQRRRRRACGDASGRRFDPGSAATRLPWTIAASAFPYLPVRWLLRDPLSFRPAHRQRARAAAGDARRQGSRDPDPLRRAALCAGERSETHGALPPTPTTSTATTPAFSRRPGSFLLASKSKSALAHGTRAFKNELDVD